VVEREARKIVLNRMVACHCNHTGHYTNKGSPISRGKPTALDLRMRLILESLDKDKVASRQLSQDTGKSRLVLLTQLMHDRPAAVGDYRRLHRAGCAVAERIGAWMIDIKGVVRVFYCANTKSAGGEDSDQPF